MKTTINLSQFRDAFHKFGRQDNFSYEGLGALFAYLDDYEQSNGEELELDVVACCCDYAEDSYEQIADNYSLDLTEVDSDDMEKFVEDYLNEHSNVCGKVAGGFVYAQF